MGLESQFGESLENIALHIHTLLPSINLEGHCYLFSWQLEEKRGFGDKGSSLGLQDQVQDCICSFLFIHPSNNRPVNKN